MTAIERMKTNDKRHKVYNRRDARQPLTALTALGCWADNVRASHYEAEYLQMRTFKARRSWRAFFLRRHTTFGAHPLMAGGTLAARPEVHRGRFPAVLLDLELDLLTFIERAQSGALDGRDVHENVPASTCGLNETITLLRVEPLHRAARHRRILQVSDQGLIAPRRREASPTDQGGGICNAILSVPELLGRTTRLLRPHRVEIHSHFLQAIAL